MWASKERYLLPTFSGWPIAQYGSESLQLAHLNNSAMKHSDGSYELFVAQSFDGVQAGRFVGGVEAEN